MAHGIGDQLGLRRRATLWPVNSSAIQTCPRDRWSRCGTLTSMPSCRKSSATACTVSVIALSCASAGAASSLARSRACSLLSVILLAGSSSAEIAKALGRMRFSTASLIEASMTEAASVGLSFRSARLPSTSNRPWWSFAACALT
ncbi:hypothetical protein AJ88_46915 [Mesorhizobium amorphae CCBAU 01583]|nr:hypothetical protein AJ88_46915 [Mesorhizobium amorphae CCBAU 01583]